MRFKQPGVIGVRPIPASLEPPAICKRPVQFGVNPLGLTPGLRGARTKATWCTQTAIADTVWAD